MLSNMLCRAFLDLPPGTIRTAEIPVCPFEWDMNDKCHLEHSPSKLLIYDDDSSARFPDVEAGLVFGWLRLVGLGLSRFPRRPSGEWAGESSCLNRTVVFSLFPVP